MATDTAKKEKAIYLKMDADLYDQMRKYCIDHNYSMKALINESIRLRVEK